jgi:hypothetical protein
MDVAMAQTFADGLAQGFDTTCTGIRDGFHQTQQFFAQAMNDTRVAAQINHNRTRDDQIVKGLTKRITTCDGTVSAFVRDWLDTIEVSLPAAANIPQAAITMAAATVSGPLLREVERFLSTQPNRFTTPWNLLREHIRATFLSADEQERLRQEMENLRMSAYDDIVTYNRKFREAAEKAFPLPRNPDVDRIILHCYEKNLYSKQLVQKLVVENNPQLRCNCSHGFH